MVYCGLVSPHRSVGGDQVTLTAPRVGSGANETMRGTPTAARKWTDATAAKVQGSRTLHVHCNQYVTPCANGCKIPYIIAITRAYIHQ